MRKLTLLRNHCPFGIKGSFPRTEGGACVRRWSASSGRHEKPSSFCGRWTGQSRSARRSVATRWPRAASRISSTCFGRAPPRSPGPSVRAPSSIASDPNSRITRLPRFCFSTRMRCATLTPWSFHISAARSSQLVGFCLVAGTIRYTRYASAQTRLLRLSRGRSGMTTKRCGHRAASAKRHWRRRASTSMPT